MLDKKQINIENLFDMTRFPENLSLLQKTILIAYIPLGILLVLIRLCLLAIWIVSFTILPTTQIGKKIFCKGVCIISGILYKFENKNYITQNYRFVVSNHTYTFEFLPFIAQHWCIITGRKAVIGHWLLRRISKLVDIIVVDDLVSKYAEISKKTTPIFVFAEGATTSGKVGLLKYNPLIFFYGEPILPIATKIQRPLPIACCRLHLAIINDFLWLLYVPWTLCKYTILPPQKILAEELPDDFARRIQTMTAEALGVAATNFTVDDKNKLREIKK